MYVAEQNHRPIFPRASRAASDHASSAVAARAGHRTANEIGVISGIRMIIVPVEHEVGENGPGTASDLVFDEGFSESRRWIEIAPPSQTVALVLRGRRADEGRRECDRGRDCAVFLNCEDFHRTHHDLTQRGVRFPVPPAKMDFGWLSMFEDDEGKHYVLGQW